MSTIKKYIQQEIKNPKYSETMFATSVFSAPNANHTIDRTFNNLPVKFILLLNFEYSYNFSAGLFNRIITDIYGRILISMVVTVNFLARQTYPFFHLIPGNRLFLQLRAPQNSSQSFTVGFQLIYNYHEN